MKFNVQAFRKRFFETEAGCSGNEKEEKRDLTELVFVLDRSGSMSGLEADTIGGFNALIEKQKKEPGRCLVTTVLFDSRIQTIHDRVELQAMKPMTEKDYAVGGCTALLDALGSTIRHIVDIHRYARAEDVPARTTFVVMTDGLENASRLYSSEEVKRMIRHEQEKYGWEFLFLAANIDAVETAGRMGIRPERAVNYNADRQGTRIAYEALSCAVSARRACAAPLDAAWSRSINEDYEKRGKA
ncbi:MAG: VWA domain-containing protein [Oscillospiraceae bacterium]|nr:VWA domain-containing protein [Oscillospiraceae bacterium]